MWVQHSFSSEAPSGGLALPFWPPLSTSPAHRPASLRCWHLVSTGYAEHLSTGLVPSCALGTIVFFTKTTVRNILAFFGSSLEYSRARAIPWENWSQYWTRTKVRGAQAPLLTVDACVRVREVLPPLVLFQHLMSSAGGGLFCSGSGFCKPLWICLVVVFLVFLPYLPLQC